MLAKNVRGSHRWSGRTAECCYTSGSLAFSKLAWFLERFGQGKWAGDLWRCRMTAGKANTWGEDCLVSPHHSMWDSTDTCGTFKVHLLHMPLRGSKYLTFTQERCVRYRGGLSDPQTSGFPSASLSWSEPDRWLSDTTNNTRRPWTETYWWMFFVLLKKRTILRWDSSYRKKKYYWINQQNIFWNTYKWICIM